MTLTTSQARLAVEDIRARRSHSLTDDDLIDLLMLKVRIDEKHDGADDLTKILDDALSAITMARSEVDDAERKLENALDTLR